MTISWPNPRKFCRDRALGIILEEYCTYPIARSWLVGNDSPSTSLPSRFSRRSRDRTFLVVTARIKWGGLPSSIFSAPKANWKGFVGGFGSFTADRYLYAGLCVARDHSIRLFSTRHSAARKWDFLCIAFYADNFPTLRLCQSREAHWKPSACVVIAKSRTHWYLRILGTAEKRLRMDKRANTTDKVREWIYSPCFRVFKVPGELRNCW